MTADGMRGTLGAPPQKLGYLDFIDGVRTIAVVSVLLFHADSSFLPGGFVGVDVFFVISGFLITRVCMSDRFTLSSFYLSRARRILPAYFVTLIVSGLIALAVLLPVPLISSSTSLAAGSLLLQNFVFWKQLNYFSPAIESNPYLHTWSLAVEWQFYLIFPFIFLFIRARKVTLRVTLIIVFLITLAASSYGAIYKPEPTFYLTPFRTWEFLVGSFVALAPARNELFTRFGGTLSLIGILAVGASILIIDQSMPFPGLLALLPCLGTGAILAGGIGQPRSIVSRTLSLNPIRLVGQASYSIYLVHWPIFIFTRYVLIERESPTVTLALLSTAFCFGFLFWRYVEQPFRKPGEFGATKRWVMSGLAMATIAGIAAIPSMSHGWPQRYSPDVRALAATADDFGNFRSCLNYEPPKTLEEAKCRFGSRAVPDRPSIVLWGDSFAAALADGIDMLALQRHRTGAFLGTSSCPPLPGLDGGWPQTLRLCSELQRAVPRLLASPVDLLIVHAAWAGHRERGKNAFATAVRRSFPSYKRMARRVVIVGTVPRPRLAVPDAMARERAFGRSVDLRSSPERLADVRETNRFLAEQARLNGYVFIDPVPFLCRNACKPFIRNKPLYFDDLHINAATSRAFAQAYGGDLVPPES